MDGDFAPMTELVKLRKKFGFLLVIDDVSPVKFSVLLEKLFDSLIYVWDYLGIKSKTLIWFYGIDQPLQAPNFVLLFLTSGEE